MWCGRVDVGAVRQNAGGQWLHILRDRPEWTPPPPRPRKSSKSKRAKLPLAERAAIAGRAAGRGLHELVEHLGVDVLAELRALGVGWLSKSELVELEPWQKDLTSDGVWCVPFKNSAGNVLGIQTRDATGAKKSLAGGELGLIFRGDFSNRPGPVWMPEGMSDTVSLSSLGLAVVGRPSNAAGAELLVELLAELGPDVELVVVADRDAPRANGVEPGRAGALSTAGKIVAELGRPVKVVYPPAGLWKDARAWLAAHPDATAADWVAGVELIEHLAAPRDCTSPPAGDVVTLDTWRAELAERKVELVVAGIVGVYLDCSPTGAGKSHSDALAFEAAGGGLSIQPTHRNCAEVVADFQSRGIDAGAAPEWEYSETFDAGNCWHREARDARAMGLSVLSVACVTCPHRPAQIDKQTGQNTGGTGRCDAAGYRGQLTESKKHAVRVVTHQRAAVEGLSVLAADGLVCVHENALPVFRPEFTFDAVDVGDAVDVVGRLLNEPKSLDGMSDEQRDILDALAVGIDRLAAAEHQPPGPVSLPWVENFRPVVRRLFLMSRKLRRCVPWGSILAAFSGNVCGVSCLEKHRRKKELAGAVETSRFIHVVHQNRPSKDSLLIVSDATAERDALSLALGADVQEITPPGRLLDVHRVRQIPVDVTRKTEVDTVVKLVSGRLAAHPEWQRVGLVVLKCHRPGLEQWQAAGGLGGRVHRIGHFQAGDARGSNRFISDADGLAACDAVIVVGTPRVPAEAVRQELAARGHLAAAVVPEPGWIPTPWAGLSETGGRVVVNVRGYDVELWETVRRGMVRAELRQALGRGRASLANGIPVEVLSKEETGVELADVSPVGLGLGDGPRRLLDVMGRMSSGAGGGTGEKWVKNPSGDIEGKFTDFPVSALSAALGGESPRNVRNWLVTLERRGQVVRRGGGVGRGGVRWGLVAGAAELVVGPVVLVEPCPVVEVAVEPSPPVGLVSVAGGVSPGEPCPESPPVEHAALAVESLAELPVVESPVDRRPWTCRGEPDWGPRAWDVSWAESPLSPPPVPRTTSSPPPAAECWWAKPFPAVDRWWDFSDDAVHPESDSLPGASGTDDREQVPDVGDGGWF